VENEIVGACSTYGEMRTPNILVGKPHIKRTFGRHRYRWKDNMERDLKETQC
jgi:hypothetical protein